MDAGLDDLSAAACAGAGSGTIEEVFNKYGVFGLDDLSTAACAGVGCGADEGVLDGVGFDSADLSAPSRSNSFFTGRTLPARPESLRTVGDDSGTLLKDLAGD